MNKKITLLAIASMFLMALTTFAQPPQEGRPDRPDRRPDRPPRPGAPDGPGGPRVPGGGMDRLMGMFPMMKAIDANEDGEISSEEIDAAATALKTLDKDNDGKLSKQELRPDFSAMGGPGVPGGMGGPGGREGAGRGDVMVQRMMANDKDGDGKLSKTELPERLQTMFERGDTNSDGFLDKKELEKMSAERSGRGEGAGRERESDRQPKGSGEGQRPKRPSGGGGN